MKKIAFGIVLLLLAGAIGAPKLIGDRAHQAYLKSFSDYPVAGSGVSFEQRSYAQSWFSSDAVTVMKIPLGLPDIEHISLVINSHISHGPIISTDNGIATGLANVRSDLTIEGLPDSAQKLADKYLPAGTVTANSLIDFSQRTNDSMHVARIDFGGDKSVAMFGGMNLNGVSKLDYSMLKGKFDVLASRIGGSGASVDIADASGSYDMHKSGDMLFGKMEMTFPNINAKFPQGAVVLEELKVASSTEEQAGKLSMSANVGAKKVNAPIPITAFQYDVEAKHIDMKALKLWTEISRERQRRQTGQVAALHDKKVSRLIELLLQKDSEMGLRFTLDGMGGRLNVASNIRSVGLPEGVHVDGLTDKQALINAADIHMTVNVDERVVMATPLAAMVAPFIQRGQVVKEGDKLATDIKLAMGKLTVNGIPTPMPGAN